MPRARYVSVNQDEEEDNHDVAVMVYSPRWALILMGVVVTTCFVLISMDIAGAYYTKNVIIPFTHDMKDDIDSIQDQFDQVQTQVDTLFKMISNCPILAKVCSGNFSLPLAK